MMKSLCVACVALALCAAASAQQLELHLPAKADDAAVSEAMPDLATRVIAVYRDDDRSVFLNNLLRLQVVAGRYAAASATLKELIDLAEATHATRSAERLVPFGVYAQAKARQAQSQLPYIEAFNQSFRELSGRMDDETALRVQYWFGANLYAARADWQRGFDQAKATDTIALKDALALVNSYLFAEAYGSFMPLIDPLVAEDDQRRYIVQDNVMIRTKEGATLSAVVIRKKGVTGRQPASLFFNIYTDLGVSRYEAKQAAVHGYAGVVADARGKRLSPDEIAPWEHEAQDTYGVIDWIRKQPWSNGKVGMYGGSYTGFAQWAAAKTLHPALKTIVPYVATHPGLGLPMQNNVFQNANYGWYFYVSDNKYLDYKTYYDRDRWSSLNATWYASGRPYREIDSVDGTPNKLLQRQLRHPAYDKYWQDMTPYKREFAKISIPVLSITGYFDDAQVAAVHYMTEHLRYNKSANHYLLIGPYDHFGAQRAHKPDEVNGYAIDPVAQFDTAEITYQWFDHVMRGGPRPALLKDRINYEVMGANVWRHAPSISAMSNETLTLYLTDAGAGEHYRLALEKPGKPGFLEQSVDFADRTTSNNLYPAGVLRDKIEIPNGLSFVSEPFEAPVSIDGIITGEIKATLNKKDMDVTLALYEITPAGQYFNLAYYLGRASYAGDMSVRKLLTPGRKETIHFDRTPMVSRQLARGSRLLVLLNVNKNEWAQVNYGTGQDVSDESIADAKEPLQVHWHNDSYIKVPLWK
jgi:putative CocE/NonD family hydrolase